MIGAATPAGDTGVGRDGAVADGCTGGMELRAKRVLVAGDAHGSARGLIRRFELDDGRDPRKHGLGEIWEVPADRHGPGLVQRSSVWPLHDRMGGPLLYGIEGNQVPVGFAVRLGCQKPTLSPSDELRRFETHLLIAEQPEGGGGPNHPNT